MSAVVILVVVAAFAAVVLSIHSAQLSTVELGVHRLRAQAAAMAGTHLALWKVRNDADLQRAIARVVHEGDTSFAAQPLFRFQGTVGGASFGVDLWPGPDTVRLKSSASAAGAYQERWAQMAIRLPARNNVLAGGDFEDPGAIYGLPLWLGEQSVGKWLAGYGLSQIDDPRGWWGALPWNVSAEGGNHYAESLRWTNVIAQYVRGAGLGGALALELDFIRRSGNLEVTVRGVNTLPRIGLLFPGTPGYEQWSESGTVLYRSGELARSDSWRHLSATIDVGPGYAYYVVQVEATGGLGNPHTTERAVDNVVLRSR